MATQIADRSNPSRQAKVDEYGSLYVVLVNSSGTVIKATPQEENRAGSDCSGSDGATGRVLTLQNTTTSGAPISVWVDDQIIGQADITVSHLSASSTVTFDNINVYDAQTIRVRYYV